MALDYHDLLLLEKIITKYNIQSVLSFGRQACILNRQEEKKIFHDKKCGQFDVDGNIFYEAFLKKYNIKKIKSVDFFKHEGADILHDLNKPLSKKIASSWDLVIDAGTGEHILNFFQLLQNLKTAVKKNGWIFMTWPSNGYSGHGFYQVSPELPFTYFSKKNGFGKTFVWLKTSSSKIYELPSPESLGVRHNISYNKCYLLVLAQKLEYNKTQETLQSDYRKNLYHTYKKNKKSQKIKNIYKIIKKFKINRTLFQIFYSIKQMILTTKTKFKIVQAWPPEI